MSKKLYEQPTTKVLVVRVGGCFLVTSPLLGKAGQAGANDIYNAYDEDF